MFWVEMIFPLLFLGIFLMTFGVVFLSLKLFRLSDAPWSTTLILFAVSFSHGFGLAFLARAIETSV